MMKGRKLGRSTGRDFEWRLQEETAIGEQEEKSGKAVRLADIDCHVSAVDSAKSRGSRCA
jgi:hypothetical protein